MSLKSADDIVFLVDDDDYLRWGNWVVRLHKEAHFMASIDSSVEYFPSNASCALDHDVSYWKNVTNMVDATVRKESQKFDGELPEVYERANFDIVDLGQSPAVIEERHKARSVWFATLRARYDAQLAVFNNALHDDVCFRVEDVKFLLSVRLWALVCKSLGRANFYMISSVDVLDVRQLLLNVDEVFQDCKSSRRVVTDVSSRGVSVPDACMSASCLKTDVSSRGVSVPGVSMLSASLLETDVSSRGVSVPGVSMSASCLKTDVSSRGVSVPDVSMLSASASKSSKSAWRRPDDVVLPIIEVVDPSVRNDVCAVLHFYSNKVNLSDASALKGKSLLVCPYWCCWKQQGRLER